MVDSVDGFVRRNSNNLLVGITLLGAALRFYHINYQSLWLDELYSIVPTGPENSLQSIIEYSKGDQPPLLFIYIHYMFKLFGYTELVGRLSCAVIGIISIPMIYLLGKACLNKSVGLMASLLTAINYFQIYYSQELRFYAMAFLFAVLSYLFFIRAFKGNRTIDYLGYFIFTVCLLYTHYYGMIIFGVQAITFLILIYFKRNNSFIIKATLSGIAIIIAFVPWLPTVLNDLSVNVGWIKVPDPHFVAQYFYYYSGKDALSTVIFCFFIYLFIKSFIALTSDEIEKKLIYITLSIWIILSYLIPYIRSITAAPMLADRYTIVTLPAWILLFAIGWSKINNLKIKFAVAPVLVLAAVINLFFFKQHYTRLKKDQWREASQFVISKNTSHYPVYSTLAWNYNFYFRNQSQKVNNLYTSDLSKTDKLWLLLAHLTEEEMEAQIAALNNYKIIERRDFFGSVAVFLERKL